MSYHGDIDGTEEPGVMGFGGFRSTDQRNIMPMFSGLQAACQWDWAP